MTGNAVANLNTILGVTSAVAEDSTTTERAVAAVPLHSIADVLYVSGLDDAETYLRAALADRLVTKDGRLAAALMLGDVEAARKLASAASKLRLAPYLDPRSFPMSPSWSHDKAASFSEAFYATAREALNVTQRVYLTQFETNRRRFGEHCLFSIDETPAAYTAMKRAKMSWSANDLWTWVDRVDDTTLSGRQSLEPLALWVQQSPAVSWVQTVSHPDNPFIGVAADAERTNVTLQFMPAGSEMTADDFGSVLGRLRGSSANYVAALSAALRQFGDDQRFIAAGVDECVSSGTLVFSPAHLNDYPFSTDQLVSLLQAPGLWCLTGSKLLNRLAVEDPAKFAVLAVGPSEDLLEAISQAVGDYTADRLVWDACPNALLIAVLARHTQLSRLAVARGLIPAAPSKLINRKLVSEIIVAAARSKQAEDADHDLIDDVVVGWFEKLAARHVIGALQLAAHRCDAERRDMPSAATGFLAEQLDRVGNRRDELIAAMAHSNNTLGELAEKFVSD